MHFRVRKNVIQLIRTSYNESKKRGDSIIVASVRLAKPELTDELRTLLTADEIHAFDYWLTTQHRTETLQEELAALTLADTLQKATKWFERQGDSEQARLVAGDAMFGWQALRKILTKNQLLD